jgi:hypothetical protein
MDGKAGRRRHSLGLSSNWHCQEDHRADFLNGGNGSTISQLPADASSPVVSDEKKAAALATLRFSKAARAAASMEAQ